MAGGRLQNADFASYQPPRFSDMPELDIHLLNRPDLPSVGGGETPIIAIAPAIANAVFHATGQRIRSMPMRLAAKARQSPVMNPLTAPLDIHAEIAGTSDAENPLRRAGGGRCGRVHARPDRAKAIVHQDGRLSGTIGGGWSKAGTGGFGSHRDGPSSCWWISRWRAIRLLTAIPSAAARCAC
jgi:hypothetical protein